jgi:hypothetical protein
MVGSEVHGTICVVITHNANDAVLLAAIRNMFRQVFAALSCVPLVSWCFVLACVQAGVTHMIVQLERF